MKLPLISLRVDLASRPVPALGCAGLVGQVRRDGSIRVRWLPITSRPNTEGELREAVIYWMGRGF